MKTSSKQLKPGDPILSDHNMRQMIKIHAIIFYTTMMDNNTFHEHVYHAYQGPSILTSVFILFIYSFTLTFFRSQPGGFYCRLSTTI